MSSSSHRNRLKSAAICARIGEPSDFACDWCFEKGKVCVVMSSRDEKLTCSECRRRGKRCVTTSWGSIEKTMDETELAIAEDEKEQNDLLDRLAELRARLSRKRKVLEQAKKRAEEQFWCLERELKASGEENLLAEVRTASFLERELFGPFDDGTPLAVPDTR